MVSLASLSLKVRPTVRLQAGPVPLPEVLPEPECPQRQLCGGGDSGCSCPGPPFLPPQAQQPLATMKNGSRCPGRESQASI